MAGSPLLTAAGIDSLINTSEAATLCGVSAATIRVWATRGTLTASGVDHRGRKLYKLLDVAKAEQATRDRARRAA